MTAPSAMVEVPVRLVGSLRHGGAALHDKEVRVIALSGNSALVEHEGWQHKIPRAWLVRSRE